MNATTFRSSKKEDTSKPQPKPGLPPDQAKKLHAAVQQANHDSKNRPRSF